MKRLLLYAHYDRDARIDPHVRYTLTHLRPHCDRIVFVSNNETLPEADLEALRSTADDIITRPNRGFDFGAWHAAMARDPGLFDACDELLLVNSSCFGPLFPPAELFERMAARDCDAWALTGHPASGPVPAHLQSYFLLFRRPVLASDRFRAFWERAAQRIRTFDDAVRYGETELHRLLRNAGFRTALFAELADGRTERSDGHTHSFAFNAADEMILRCRLPFVKVKAFGRVPCSSVLKGGDILDAIRLSGSDYPTTLIRDFLFRCEPLSWSFSLPQELITDADPLPAEPLPGWRVAGDPAWLPASRRPEPDPTAELELRYHPADETALPGAVARRNAQWRIDALTASPAMIDRIRAAFAADPQLALVMAPEAPAELLSGRAARRRIDFAALAALDNRVLPETGAPVPEPAVCFVRPALLTGLDSVPPAWLPYLLQARGYLCRAALPSALLAAGYRRTADALLHPAPQLSDALRLLRLTLPEAIRYRLARLFGGR